MMPPQPTSTTFLIIPLILNTIYAPPQTREPPMASASEPVVFQLSNHQRHDGLDSGPSASANHLSWLPPAGICSDHFGIANTTDSSSVLLLLLVSLPDRGDPHPPAPHGHPGRNNTNTEVDVDRMPPPWTSLPLEPGTYGVPHLGSEPVHSADRFGLNFSLDVGLFSLSDSSNLFPAPPMTMSEQVGIIGAPALFGLVLCSGDGNGSFIQSFFQDGRRYSNEVSRYRDRETVSAAQPRKLLGGHSHAHTRNFHGHRPRPALEPKTPVHRDAAATIAICSALLALVCTVAGLVLWCMRNMLQDEASIRLLRLPDDLCPAGPRRYSHRELAAATGGFPDEGMIGRGGFGPVYRGYLRDHDCHAAIKVLSSSAQAQGMREFQAEVKVITRLRHRNIVQLLGWSGEAGGLMLVYEFLPNGSLDKHLHTPQGPLLAWTDRYKIALGVGSAILYLHTECEQCVLHGDIKPANILLDTSCNAKLADFGLARLVDHGTDSRTTQVVAGTPGYMDPELVNNGRPSTEADVFSFGVVLLELACGRRPTAAAQPNATPVLLNWVRDMYHKNTILGAADRRMDCEFDHQQMRRVLVTGLWCTHHDQTQRPPIAQAMDLLRRPDAELPILPEMHSPAAASVRSLEEIAYGDLDLSAEHSVFQDSTADTAYHTSEDSTSLLECLEENGTS